LLSEHDAKAKVCFSIGMRLFKNVFSDYLITCDESNVCVLPSMP